jgi:hypothetical protein
MFQVQIFLAHSLTLFHSLLNYDYIATEKKKEKTIFSHFLILYL